ncbi:prolyl oligopeptidase family serine peptidase [Streptomyces sp. MspMP-M5]|uniref:prolyl oligopeptidase family serine peptidase n=1 Tax=unclassified Streptomyces TaxID=2593676 RepID=UPI00035EA2E2|nr:prolyl oligopeptidase family serine peptidase [Streptomyces sp. MspMP-M5]MYT33752.1 prolyl oligopeptidase family serine peptidase [Streptomyces sp. SID8354]
MADRFRFPPTPLRPEPDEIGGIGFTDPYQWLEEDSSATLAWEAAQNRFARDLLHTDPPWRLALDAARRFNASALSHRPPELHGRRWFMEHVPEDHGLPVLDVSDAPDVPVTPHAPVASASARRVLDLAVELAEPAPYGPATMQWQPSPDGQLLAYQVCGPGREPLFRVRDVDSGKILVDGLPETGACRVGWLPDGRRFFVVVIDRERLDRCRGVFQVDLTASGSAPAVCREDLPSEFPARGVSVSPEGRWALAHGPGRPSYVRDLAAPGAPWRPFLRDSRSVFRGALVGDEFIAVTDDGAPRGRVVALPLPGPATDPAGWRELVPPGDSILFSLTPVGPELVLAEHANGASRLRRISVQGAPLGEIPLPEPGMAWPGSGRDTGLVTPAGNGCTFAFSSLTRSPAAYRYDLATDAVVALTKPRVVIPDAVTRRGTARSADGTAIPYQIVSRAGVDLSVPQPLIISGYGALNIAWLPAYLFALPAAWVELGGVYVHAHLRGGGEFGTDWWRAARRDTKQRTFDDLHAVATDLIRHGHTTHSRLGVFGYSISALTAVVAVTQRPDLYRACVAALPVLDLLRCKRDPVTMADIMSVDFGDPDDPGDAAVLHRYSPYHQVRDDVDYPAVLLDCGSADRSCPAWHGRKMAARLQRATSAPHPVLLRTRQAGHTVETSPQDALLREAEHLAFMIRELGLNVA